MVRRKTAPDILTMKLGGERIACITAYDYTSALIADSASPDVILVGDSVGNVCLGYPTTVAVTLDDMIHHTRAAARGVSRSLLIADLPFGSYQSSVAQAVDSATALMRAGAEAVKLEGPYFEEITAIRKSGIPVMGHVGFTPQSVHAFGGFKVQGREDGDAVFEMAERVAEAGAFAIVLELIPEGLAQRITTNVTIATIGIGAGIHCDGEIQVFHDVLGLGTHLFKHTKRYANGYETFVEALTRYVAEVKSREFPTKDQSFESHSGGV
jgi:3-methyl-2-oxobutanoate hydroxymethyltransferase